MVGLSGGVDSAVAALLLRQAGADVQGLYMENWDAEDQYCTSAQDYQDARAVARELGIVLHRVNFAAQYRQRVFADFLADYRAGRTPNPDVLCNREIKFGVCTAHARRLGASAFATGHYACVEQADDGPALYKARDETKDQSYFLHAVPRGELQSVLFPLATFTKAQVRERAREAGLPVHDKADSTGICFIGERPFADFLARYIEDTPGPIESLQGETLGTHRGLPFYTIGQRDGLMIGGRHGHAAEPWYVARKDSQRNTLVVAQRHEQQALCSQQVRVQSVNWLCEPPALPHPLNVKLRYRQADQAATLEPSETGVHELRFAEPQRAATCGQYAVFYQSRRCLGGGLIADTL